MKRVGLLLLCLLLSASSVRAEEIQSFKGRIDILKSGQISVQENITYDFGSLKKHGIFRTIPFVKKNNDGKKYRLSFAHFSVSLGENTSYPFEQSVEREKINLKIGEAARTLRGTQNYQIDYTVKGAIENYSDHDELYWNLTGNGWVVPINQVETTLTLPKETAGGKVKMACYTGFLGDKEQNCEFSEISGKEYVIRTTKPLLARQGLTIVFGFPRGLVAELPPEPYSTFWETWYGKLLSITLSLSLVGLALWWYLLYPAWIVIKWVREGRDPEVGSGVASAWFSSPKVGKQELTPAELGTLVDEKAETKDVLAMVVDLARRGYFKIEEQKKNDFYFIKQKGWSQDTSLLSFEKTFLQAMFEEGNTVRVKDTELYDTFSEITSDLYERVVSLGLFPKNPNSTRNFYIFIAIMAGSTLNILLLAIALIFGLRMPRKTSEGVKAANEGKSLRNFLVSQDRQLEFQAENKLMFEKLLPFAVAFGVEKIWAKRFAELNVPPPEWYSSYRNQPFSSTLFVNNLSHSLGSVKSSFTPPTTTTSSRGFSSGFSGGGFSGGGGGGGGGGSW